MKDKVKPRSKTANKLQKKRIIDRKGAFTVQVGSELLDVMFFNDYKKLYQITEYDFLKAEKNGIRKRLKIGNRIRSSSVVVNGDITEISELNCKNIADKDGFFSLVLNGRARKAIFVNEYAKIQNISKVGIIKRANSKNARIELVQLNRATSSKPILFVVLKEPRRQPEPQEND